MNTTPGWSNRGKFRKSRDTEEKTGQQRYGFIAQDILELEGSNNVIIDNEQEEHLKYKGEHLVPVLVNAIKELSAKVEELESNSGGTSGSSSSSAVEELKSLIKDSTSFAKLKSSL